MHPYPRNIATFNPTSRYRARVKRRLQTEKARHRNLVTALAALEEERPPSPTPLDGSNGDYGDGYDNEYDSRSGSGSKSRSGSEEGWSGSDYDDGDGYRRRGNGKGKRRGGVYESLPTDQGGGEGFEDYAIDDDMDNDF